MIGEPDSIYNIHFSFSMPKGKKKKKNQVVNVPSKHKPLF